MNKKRRKIPNFPRYEVTTGEVFNSIKEAAETYNLAHSNIVACCNGRRNKCGGMEWEYVE